VRKNAQYPAQRTRPPPLARLHRRPSPFWDARGQTSKVRECRRSIALRAGTRSLHFQHAGRFAARDRFLESP
jgi:hypothetical protein